MFDDPFTDCQTNTTARWRAAANAFEYAEYPLMVLRRNSHAVIAHRENPFAAFPYGSDPNAGRLCAAVL